MITVAHIFPQWTTVFGYADEALERSGMATSAITSDADEGQILAMAELDEVGEGGAWIRESHFRDGRPVFQARSFFAHGIGEKQKEEIIEGVKETDYYLFWPLSHWP
jgi:hypothetical protein